MSVTVNRPREDNFKIRLRENLSPARAISSPEHLKGRQQKLQQIDRAFNSPGKHIFVYGDRGVGKTSLAQTAAILHQSSDREPVLVACDDSGFFNLVRDAVKLALPVGDPLTEKKVEEKLRLGWSGMGYDFQRSITQGVVPAVESINDAVLLLRLVGTIHSKTPVIIFDEFDQMAGSSERKKCADLIKQVSDQAVNVRFIICGIGSSLEELIGIHLSTARYISPVLLEPLSHDARWEIIESAADALGMEVQRPHLIRIGQISDGFPYYVHLIGEQLFWSAFDEGEGIERCEQKHFEAGVRAAVQEAETTLRTVYERATQKYSDDYTEVLWALADGQLMRKQVSGVYDTSYMRIMSERPSHRKRLSKQTFLDRINKLKTERHGRIIVPYGAGWYQFKESIVRGYVRLRAEEAGVELGREGFN